MGSSNILNVVQATFAALKELQTSGKRRAPRGRPEALGLGNGGNAY
jgi:ribosomal protein S5